MSLKSNPVYKKIHVVHLLPDLRIGGMENGVVNLINNADNEKFKLTLCCLKAEGPLKERISNTKVEIINLKQKSGKRYFLIPRLAILFKKINADIVHTHNFYTGVYGISAAKLAGIPVIIHGEHGGYHDLKQTKLGKIKFFYKLCDAVITVSITLKEEILNNIPSVKEKIETIINGVDTKKFPKKESNIRTNSNICIGTVGRLTPEKDYPTLLKAFKIIHNEFQAAKLIIVGKGELEHDLKKTAENLDLKNHVDFLGSRNDIPDILSDLDIFALSSSREGCSNVILEAFATGLPVVATNAGDNPFLLAEGRGIIVKPGDELELAEALKSIINDENKKMDISNKAYQWVLEKRSLQGMVTDYLSFYTKLYYKKTGKNIS